MRFNVETPQSSHFLSSCEKTRLCGICLLATAFMMLAGGCAGRASSRVLPDVPDELNEMIKIPAGKFTMGTEAPDISKAMGPPHEVYTDEFLLARYPVTNCQYKKFMDATGAAAPPQWVDGWYPEDQDFIPVVNIMWEEAVAYVAWAGMRLPTEAEWEHAARGDDGRMYQWGNDWDPSKCHCGETGYLTGGPVSVFEFSGTESQYGCVQLTGNVWEWCSDFVVKAPYDISQNKNPRGLAGSLYHVSRGGSWTTDELGCRTSFRCITPIGARWGYEGLRCAKDSLKPGDLRPPGMENMVLVPAGEFIYGSDSMTLNTLKQKTVFLDAYYIDKYCVTNDEYRRFVLATNYPAPRHWQNWRYEEGKDKCPVNNVSWEDGAAYAKWAGKRLPTEAEWEKAARGTDGRLFPWGEDYDPTALNGREAKIGGPCPVDNFPSGVSPYGCYQMSGNMWEWVADWYDPYYGDVMPDRNPKGPATGTLRTLRGGCWSSLPANDTTMARCQAVIGARTTYSGFRCVKDADAKTVVNESKRVFARLQIKQFRTAIDTFKLDQGRYPNALEELVKTPDGVPLVDGVPKDPWGNEYVYRRGEGDSPCEVVSCGSDGKTGGEGDARDVTSSGN